MQERERFVRFPRKLGDVVKTTSDRSCHTCENKYRAIAGFSVVAGIWPRKHAVFYAQKR